MLTFSIITPTVLRHTLERTCRSIDMQRHSNWQHLIMVDKPEDALRAAERRALGSLADPRRQIRFCTEAHRDCGNTCRWNAWDFVKGDYVLYLDDDDYYVDGAFDALEGGIGAEPVPPVWGIFPVSRHGSHFFNIPPGHGRTCSNQFFHVPRVGERELRYPKRGYCADGELIESLRQSYRYVCIDSGKPLAVIEVSNLGVRVPVDRTYVESAFQDYVTQYSIETEAISLAASWYLWDLLGSRRVERLLDLGSGWSSFLFRLYKKVAAPDLVVCSVDESEHWLGTTARFLAKHDLDTSHLCLWPRFGEQAYDLTFYDMGRPWDRPEHLGRILNMTRCVLVCDDMHYDGYRVQLETEAQAHGLRLDLLKTETMDRFGRFAGQIVR